MLKPVCVKCQRFFRMRKQGFYFIEGMPIAPDARPGRDEPEKWKPYKVWAADRWECEGCGANILSGFGLGPLAIHHQDDFEREIERRGAHRLQVNDC